MWSRSLLNCYSKYVRTLCARQPTSAATLVKEPPAELVASDVSKFKVGDKHHGFEVKNVQHISEFNVTALYLQHLKTKAEYLHLYRDDLNNVFSVCFRTTPKDSTGLPHILEHTVLCGSELYPVRDPFFKMLNRSLATFMNAMTGPDYTFYPFSTQNEKDYHNLQKVYLDAVFKPNLKLLDFMQEGWRLENTNPQDKNSPLAIKGVVYNEMKGVFAENENITGYKTLNTILPDHTYGVISGGDPSVIPKLTWEDLKEFHKKHYHPSNARFYSYGNFPLLPSLKYINEKYLSKYDAIDVSHTVVPSQSRWHQSKRFNFSYRYDNMGEAIEKQNSVVISYLMSDIADIYDTFVLQFITELLVRGPNAPFYKSLIEPKISGGFTPGTGLDTQLRDTVFTLGLQGLEKSKTDDVVLIFEETLNKVIDGGFEDAHIESVLHRYELGIKHQTANFGLNLLYSIVPLWNHNGEVLKMLKINTLIDRLKEDMIKQPKFLQDYIKKYFKDNRHRVILTMTPDVGFDKTMNEYEQKLLKEKTSKLTDKDKETIFVKGLELLKEQSTKQDTNVLPTLQINDIKGDVPRYPISQILVGNIPTQVCRVDTNGITYFKGIIGTTELSMEQKMMLPLFCYIITRLGSKSMDHLQFDTMVNKKTAGLSFSVYTGESLHQLHTHEPGIMISSYCLDKNSVDMWDLWLDLFSLTELKDIERFEMLVKLYMANLSHGLVDYGHSYAMSAARAMVSGSGYQNDLLTGLHHISYMKRLTRTSNYKALLQELSEIARILFDKNKLRCSINVSDGSHDQVLKGYERFIKQLPGNVLSKKDKNIYVTPKIWYPEDHIQCQHHVLNIPVYFCAKAILTVPYVDPNFARLRVLAKLLSSKYLHLELREKAGAYGAGARMSADGVLEFFTYRDPNHLPSIDTFDKSSTWLQKELVNTTEQEVLEAKLGVFQAVDAPKAPGERGQLEFQKGLTPEILQRHRANIMSTNLEQLKSVGEKYLGENRKVLEAKVLVGPVSKECDTSNRRSELWTVMSNE